MIDTNLKYCSNFEMTVTDEQKNLPTMRWPPKMRKTPIGYRLIVASK